MNRFGLILAAATLMVALLPGAASAAVTQYSSSSCTQAWNAQGNPVPFVCLTESPSFGGDKLVLTGSSDIADLNLQNHSPSENCDSRPPWQDIDNMWNDCISSVWAKLGTNDSICLHANSHYGNLIWWAAAPSSPSGGVWTYSLGDFGGNNNVTSSVRLQQSGTDCNNL